MGKNNDRPGQHHSGTGQQGSPEPAPTCKARRALPWHVYSSSRRQISSVAALWFMV